MTNISENKRGLFFMLALVFAGVVAFALVVPSSESRFLGFCLLAVGAFNVLLHRRFGRQTFEGMKYMPAFTARFWTHIGQKGTQILYLWIGIILAATGLLLLMRSA